MPLAQLGRKMTTMVEWRRSYAEIQRWIDELYASATGDEIVRAIEGRLKMETDPNTVHCLKFKLASAHEEQGNEAASDALHRELLPEVDYWYRKLYRTH